LSADRFETEPVPLLLNKLNSTVLIALPVTATALITPEKLSTAVNGIRVIRFVTLPTKVSTAFCRLLTPLEIAPTKDSTAALVRSVVFVRVPIKFWTADIFLDMTLV
jgi:hypothetical protein